MRAEWQYGALLQVNGANGLVSGGRANGTSINVTSNSSVALSVNAGCSALAQNPLLLQGGRQYSFSVTVTVMAPPLLAFDSPSLSL